MSEILVIGGAGYIGSHVILELLKHQQKIVTLDDLSSGSKNSILGGTFYQGCMSDRNLLQTIFKNHQIKSVMLLAGFIDVAESVTNPLKYYNNNVKNTLILLDEMIKHQVLNIIFSSTASIYKSKNNSTITIGSAQHPANPYARSKLMIENILKDYEVAYKLKHVIFRYFNAAGADPEGRIGFHEPLTHLIPQTLKAASGRIKLLSVYGDDYDTKDGTCVRDYIHVMDLASAHYLALIQLYNKKESAFYNLGNGKGYSVREVAKISQEITQVDFEIVVLPRRAGDPPYIVADASYANKKLKWQPKFSSLRQIIQHSWNWETKTDWTSKS